MNKPNECNSRHLTAALGNEAQRETGSQSPAPDQRKSVDNDGHALQGLSTEGPDLGSKLGSNPAPVREQTECEHERITLLSPVGPFVCAECGTVVDRRFAHPAATLETGSGTPDTTGAR